MRIVYSGLDAGSTTCHLVALDHGDGSEVVNQKFDTSEKNLLAAFKAIKGQVHVHLEASELTRWIRDVIRPVVYRVVVSDPTNNAWIARDPHKKDGLDAMKLAVLLRIDKVQEVYYDDRQDRVVFKQVVRHYDDVHRQQAQLKVKIKSRYRVLGVVVRGTTVYGARGRKAWIEKVPVGGIRTSLEQLYSILDHTLQVEEEAYAQMVELAKQYPEIARFDKVPGVGTVGGCRFSGYLQTPHRFPNKRKLWRYCGLAVTDRSSDGKPLGRPRIDWTGHPRLKDMSYKAFLGAKITKADNLFKRTFERVLRSTKDRTHARLTTQRKIVSVLWAMWRDNAEYKDESDRLTTVDEGKAR